MSAVHVRYEGESLDIEFQQLDIGPDSSDEAVRTAVAGYLENQGFDSTRSKLRNFVVDRNSLSGDVTLRPQAVFG